MTISSDGATAAKNSMIFIVLQRLFPTVPMQTIKRMAEAIKERVSGMNFVQMKKALKEIFSQHKVPDEEIAIIAEAILEETGGIKTFTAELTVEEVEKIARDLARIEAEKALKGEIRKKDILDKSGNKIGGGGKYLPSVVAVGVSKKTGKIYIGYSGKDNNPSRLQTINKELQKRLDNEEKKLLDAKGRKYFEEYNNGVIAYEAHSLDNCAEFNIVNQALEEGENIDDIFVHALRIHPKKETVHWPPCDNCKHLYPELNIVLP
jgi:hypothetical protein